MESIFLKFLCGEGLTNEKSDYILDYSRLFCKQIIQRIKFQCIFSEFVFPAYFAPKLINRSSWNFYVHKTFAKDTMNTFWIHILDTIQSRICPGENLCCMSNA